MPGAERDPRTGLPPRAVGLWHDVPAEKPLHPRNIIRQTVFCQASIRSFLYTRRVIRGVRGIRRPASPAVATSLFFCKYLRSPSFVDVQVEASATCALICSRETRSIRQTRNGLKLGDLSDAYNEYSARLPEGHPALMMVLERFEDVVVEAEEDALQKMQDVSLPSEAEAKLRETMLAWRSPEERPGGGLALFSHAKETIEKLRLQHEQVLIARLPSVNSQIAYAAIMAEVEREFVGTRTVLRSQVRGGRNRHKDLLTTELQTMYGWPPTGPGPSLKRAGRRYVAELGIEHPTVEDFLAATRRHLKVKDDKCINDMVAVEREILRLRDLVNAHPPYPKLMRESYMEELNEKSLEAIQNLEHWEREIGIDNVVYLRFLRSTLGVEKFLDHIEAKAAEVANEIRALGPRVAASLEENHTTEARSIAATSLAHLLEPLEVDGRQAQASALKAEFASELKRAEEAVRIFKDQDEDVDEGWHKPPGFESIADVPRAPEPPPPPPAKKEIRMERELPGMREAQGLTMRLHGVDFEDVNRHNELLLLEMCADLIAEECKIPRDCIFNMSFSEPLKKVAPPADAEMPDVELPESERATSKQSKQSKQSA